MSIFYENEEELDEKNEPLLANLDGESEFVWDNKDIPNFVTSKENGKDAVNTSLGEFTSIFYEADDVKPDKSKKEEKIKPESKPQPSKKDSVKESNIDEGFLGINLI